MVNIIFFPQIFRGSLPLIPIAQWNVSPDNMGKIKLLIAVIIIGIFIVSYKISKFKRNLNQGDQLYPSATGEIEAQNQISNTISSTFDAIENTYFTIRQPVAFASIFIWFGFIGAISFMEAWLKFRAPGITLPLGLGIGRLVFNALNKVEWALLFIIIIDLFPVIRKNIIQFPTLLVLVIILLMQTFWLLPVLDHRAELHITNQAVTSSNFHFVYVGLELIKISTLIIFGYILLKKNQFKNIIL